MLSSGSAAISGISPMNSYNSGEKQSSNNDIDYGADLTVNGFFSNGQLSEFKKHDDLKQMLDSNKDGLKLEAMKRIIGMVAKGRDASDLFPAVVKNVVSKNIEVKKLVYVYLVRYAEEQQDLALLSISTFQRALKDPNQLIRASALRVLSSIRVPMIVPIVMLAIRESSSDMSPYVRKTAAHAIPKLYALDVEQKDELIQVIEKLLADRTTLVVGSAVMAFEEVCPERTDLIHKNYRKLCNLMVDVDEWGQVLIINMLTRYARTQFTDPNNLDGYVDDDEQAANKPFYEDTSSDEEPNDSDCQKIESPKKSQYSLDADHRLLLRQTKPLLQSRNASVVMAVAQLYHHISPKAEVNVVAKALIRLLRSHKEVQSVVLTCIASMSSQRKSIFDPYMKSFFVRTSDQTHIKLLKLDILTNLATAINISVILREFQTYISSHDKEFVAATIQAIGRCAGSIKEVTDTCLNGLVHLLSNRDEYVVAESVVVIKKLLQTQENEHREIITQMAKLLDFIAVPAARASILWLLGEYNNRVPKIAPDVLRKLAKSFVDEEDVVKLQVLNLAVKLFLTNPAQTELLCQYVFNLARYDQNYDIRDRARFLKQFIFPTGNSTELSSNAKQIFLAAKPAPMLKSNYSGREKYQLGSLSHFLNVKANGYKDLPNFPTEAPDSSVRDVEVQAPMDFSATMITRPDGNDSKSHRHKSKGGASARNKAAKERSFYSESDKSSSDGEDENEVSSSSQESSSGSGSGESDSESSGGEKSKTKVVEPKKKVKPDSTSEDESGTADSESDSESDSSDSGSSSDDESSGSPAPEAKKPVKNTQPTNGQPKKPPVKSNLDLLLDLEMPAPTTMGSNIMTPSLGGFLTPMTPGMQKPFNAEASASESVELVGPQYVSTTHSELLNKVNGYGLNISYRYSRSPHLYASTMVSIELQFTNTGNVEMTDVDMVQPKDVTGVYKFAPIDVLAPKQTVVRVLGVDFHDSTQALSLEMKSNFGVSKVMLAPPVGELIRAVTMCEEYFKKERAKNRGMAEHTFTMRPISEAMIDQVRLRQRLYEVANVAEIASSEANVLHFAGETLSMKSIVMITIVVAPDNENLLISVNCEKIVIGSMLLNELKAALKN